MEIDTPPEKNQDDSQNVASSDKASLQDALQINTKLDNMDNPTECSNDKKESNRQHSNSKKVIKHALRQQAKRRRKNTTIAAGNTAAVPRIVVKPLPPQPVEEIKDVTPVVPPVRTHTTMREVLASIPGFNIKPRKRTNKKLSTAAQLEQTKEGCIDLETPDSILVNTNLRSLLNKYTFAVLPALYQHKLVQLLPAVDRPPLTGSTDAGSRLSASGLNNEFFARACLEWQERLAEGEFTPENQQKLKTEADKERSRLDPWKLKHFEPIWGDRSHGGDVPVKEPSPPPRPPIKTTIKLRPTTTISNKNKPAPLIKRLRTVGAVTRSCTNYKVELEASSQIETTTKSPIPDLLPIKTHKSHLQKAVKEAKVNSNHVEALGVVEPISNSSEVQEIQPVVNISDTIMQTNKETIISYRENNNKIEKRRRSLSAECEQRSPKRLTPSPVHESTMMETSSVKDETDSVDEVVTEKVELLDASKVEEASCNEKMDCKEDEIIETDVVIPSETSLMEEEPLHSDNNDETSTDDDKPEDSDQNSPDIDAEESHTSTSEDIQDNPSPEKIELPIGSPQIESKEQELETQENETTKEDLTENLVETTNSEETENIEDSEISKVELSTATQSDCDNQDYSDISELPKLEECSLNETFQVLPNSLILQQEAIVLEKTCPENCGSEVCMEDSAEKLEASVEESDLVRNITVDDDANEDRFLDAETYVLESGQIEVAPNGKENKEEVSDLHTTLFSGSRGNSFCTYIF